ncbi:MAG TPA: hypothetical protein VI032_19900 [Burkholderiaceae bacterium]
MPYLKGAGNDFERAINRGIGHFRSSELDAAVAAIHGYIKSPSADNVKNVRDRLAAWERHHPKEYANRGQPIHDALKAELKKECSRWHVPAEPGSIAPAAKSSDPRTWVGEVRQQLDKLGSYACADAYFGCEYDKATDKYNYNTGFARCIPASKRAQVEKLYRDMKKRGAGATTPGDAMYTPGGSWKGHNYGLVYQTVTGARAGICTQFAKAAAHVLTATRPKGPRVEIVAYKNHVYVLVGRSGGYSQGHVVPSSWTSDPRLVIVDAWAGSLGNPTVYETYASYPLKGMVNPIVLVAERPAS